MSSAPKIELRLDPLPRSPEDHQASPECQPKDDAGEFAVPAARPFLDIIHHWAATVPASLTLGGQLLSRCRLRVFRNGNLGRAVEWAVLISELPQPGEHLMIVRDGLAVDAVKNLGAPARTCLVDIADQVKALYLAPAPHEQISWFHHEPCIKWRRSMAAHYGIRQIRFTARVYGSKVIYLAHALEPVVPEVLELASGGAVQL